MGCLYTTIKENLKKPYLLTEQIYFEALRDRSAWFRLPCSGQATKCPAADSEIKAFVERMLKQREDLCDRLMDKKEYVQWPRPPSPQTLLIDIAFPRWGVPKS